MKTICLSCILWLVPFCAFSQTTVLNENFNVALPSTWSQSPAGTWSFTPNLGNSNSGCAITQDLAFALPTVSIRTPTLNLAAIANPTVTFKAALIKNNFLPPNMVLYYDSGNGRQFMARWGSGFSQPTTYTVQGGTDYQPPLDPQNIIWESCTHTLVTIPTNTAVSFIFEGELYNDGYVLLEDVVVSGMTPTLTTALKDKRYHSDVTVFPNPAVNKKLTLNAEALQAVVVTNFAGQSVPVKCTIKDANSYELNFEELPPGQYFIYTVGTGLSVTKKVIVD